MLFGTQDQEEPIPGKWAVGLVPRISRGARKLAPTPELSKKDQEEPILIFTKKNIFADSVVQTGVVRTGEIHQLYAP